MDPFTYTLHWTPSNEPHSKVTICLLGGSPGLVVMGGDSHSEGRGFESRCRILDGHFFTLIVVKLY